MTASLPWPNALCEGRTNRWQHRLNREHPTCTERLNVHLRVRMEGWRQKQLGVRGIAFKQEMNLSQIKKNELTSTGLLMEGQCAH